MTKYVRNTQNCEKVNEILCKQVYSVYRTKKEKNKICSMNRTNFTK